MNKRKIRLPLGLVLLAALVLAGCHGSPGQQDILAADGATPERAVTSAIEQVKAGNFDALMQHALPPEAYKAMRGQWDAQRKADLARITDADRVRFQQEMGKLTAPDAKQKLQQQLQPLLDQYESKYKKNIPMVVGIGRIMAETKITQSKALTPAQKSQSRGVVDALANWAQDTNWGDQAKAEQAVGIVVDSARALDLPTLDAVYHLDYAQAMQRWGTAWNGLGQLLSVYGLSLDKMLDSADVETLQQGDDTAQVRVSFQILGKPLSETVDMVREGKRWYSVDALRKWHEQQAQIAAAASAARAAAPSSVTEPTPAGSAAR